MVLPGQQLPAPPDCLAFSVRPVSLASSGNRGVSCCPTRPRTGRGRHLTIHSSRSRFAARLNSDVRPAYGVLVKFEDRAVAFIDVLGFKALVAGAAQSDEQFNQLSKLID